MRKAIFFAAVISFHCSLMMAQADDPFIETIQKVKLSVFPVACGSWPDKDNGVAIAEIYGTGFFVNFEGDFITAAHVIKDHFKWNKRGEPALDCYPVIYIPNPVWPAARWFQFRACAVDDLIDIAVCKTVTNPFMESGLHITRLHLGSLTPKDGTPVAFTGFPQLILIPVTARANVASSGPFQQTPLMDIVIDKTVWHGVSGGPLYLADGTVVGIVTRTGEGLWFGMGFARETSAFMKFLADKKITIWQEEPKHPQKDK